MSNIIKVPNVVIDSSEPPTNLSPKYFNREAQIEREYLRCAKKVKRLWPAISSNKLLGIFCGGSQTHGDYSDDSDVDFVVYRVGKPMQIHAEYSGLVDGLKDEFDIYVRHWWGAEGSKGGSIDFVITSMPFGILFDLLDCRWKQSNMSRNPMIKEWSSLLDDLPPDYQTLKQDMGFLNYCLNQRTIH
ncbi:MAG: hypothetical protein ABIA78_02600 [archaeon]